MLGVRRDAPISEKTIVIEPHLGDLTRAEGTTITEFGPVPVSWTRDGDQLRFNLTVPANTKCVLRLPARAGHESIFLNGQSVAATRQGARLAVFLAPGPQQGSN